MPRSFLSPDAIRAPLSAFIRRGTACFLAVLVCGTSLTACDEETLFQSIEADLVDYASSALTLARPELKPGLTISRVDRKNAVSINGTCLDNGSPVLIGGNGTVGLFMLECENGRYAANVAQGLSGHSGDLVATQLGPDGSILYGRSLPDAGEVVSEVALARLAEPSAAFEPGSTVRIAPGYYSNLRIVLPARLSGTPEAPLVIDGDGEVTFGPNSRIDVVGDFVTLRGFRFDRAGEANIRLYGEGGRLTGNTFDGCGRRPQDSCVMVRGPDAEIDFNIFTRSRSVSVQVRGAASGVQPTRAYIHHNQFLKISRLSGNGQEPIQVAGPGGMVTDQDLSARIESNLFYHAEGDYEAVSLKSNDNVVQWNVFKDLDAAPNIRGGSRNRIEHNLLVRTRPIRVAGADSHVVGNVILCPRDGYAIALGDQREGYDAAIGTRVEGNVALTSTAGIRMGSPDADKTAPARDNMITGNVIFGRAVIELTSAGDKFEPRPNSIFNNRLSQSPMPPRCG